MTITEKTIQALAKLRDAAANSDDISNDLARAFNVLDNDGVFRAVDEARDEQEDEDDGSCKGCEGTCCTGINGIPCSC